MPVSRSPVPEPGIGSLEELTASWPFTMVPSEVLCDPTLSVKARLVCALLCFHAREKDRCWPSQERLAALGGMSRGSVQRALAQLEKRGLVRKKRRGVKQANMYVLAKYPPRGSWLAAETEQPVRSLVDLLRASLCRNVVHEERTSSS